MDDQIPTFAIAFVFIWAIAGVGLGCWLAYGPSKLACVLAVLSIVAGIGALIVPPFGILLAHALLAPLHLW